MRAAVVPLIRLVSGLLLLHLAEMSLWAGAFAPFGLLSDFESSLYFSLTSYTTVGYGDVLPTKSWRLIGQSRQRVSRCSSRDTTPGLCGAATPDARRMCAQFRSIPHNSIAMVCNFNEG